MTGKLGKIVKLSDPKRYAIPGPLDLVTENEDESSDPPQVEELNSETGEIGNSEADFIADRNSMDKVRRRVYKGGSWKDMPHWLNPSTRRYLDENLSRSDIGFRCAMTRMGSAQLR